MAGSPITKWTQNDVCKVILLYTQSAHIAIASARVAEARAADSQAGLVGQPPAEVDNDVPLALDVDHTAVTFTPHLTQS